jgi:NAD-dependent dihydropyrimidine dehydrogenase PreA subunit
MEMVDDKVTIDHEKCNACMRCVHKCPKKAILINQKKIIKV